MVAARIGPNAIIQVAAALVAAEGAESTRSLFAQARLQHHLESPPTHMVDEADVVRLHEQLRAVRTPDDCHRIARAAGLATGDYLLANRIPAAAQWVLRRLPPSLASRALLAAIGGHSWTFAGSGRFQAQPGSWFRGTPVVLEIAHCPLCRGAIAPEPICDYYAATFERLYVRLVHDAAVVHETECTARGDRACRFVVSW